MKIQDHSLPSAGPREYWEDSKWVNEHAAEISQQYPNQWVAVVDKAVIAAGRDGAEVEKTATEQAGQKDFVIFYAEKGIQVPYTSNQSPPPRNRP